MNRILITGASGYLGKALLPLAKAKCDVIAIARAKREQTNYPYFRYCDVRQQAKALRFIHQFEFDTVINAVAVNPGGNECDMQAVNADWPTMLAKYCFENEKRLVHVSTDTVHNGLNAPYSDDAIATATSVYGKTKAAGEIGIRQNDPNAAIVRTSLIYGVERIDRGTAGFVQRINNKEEQNLFTDVLRQPILDKDLSGALLALATQDFFNGIINVAGSQVISRYEFGVKLLKFWKVKTDLVRPIKAINVAPSVPRDVRLDISLAQAKGFELSGVDENLEQFNRA